MNYDDDDLSGYPPLPWWFRLVCHVTVAAVALAAILMLMGCGRSNGPRKCIATAYQGYKRDD